MTPVVRRFPRFGLVLALALLALPAAGLWFRDVIHLYADFNSAAAQGPGGGTTPVDVPGGELEFEGAPGVIDIEAGSGGGILLVDVNPSSEAASMTATLDTPTSDDTVHVNLELTAVGGPSGLGILVADDDSGGIIDLVFDDNGGLMVGGQAGGQLVSQSTLPMHLTVVLRRPVLGPKTWKVTLTGAFGMKTWNGLFLSPGPLSVGSVVITRPAGTLGGTWKLDDLVVSSPIVGSNSQ